ITGAEVVKIVLNCVDRPELDRVENDHEQRERDAQHDRADEQFSFVACHAEMGPVPRLLGYRLNPILAKIRLHSRTLMMLRWERFYLLGPMILATGVFLTGINWGLPSRKVDPILFGQHPVW